MEFRELGRSGLRVSAISLGAMVFGWRNDRRQAGEILDLAVDRGINLIDTSNTYGSGASETILGDWLKRPGNRARVLVATKFHYWQDGDPPELKRDLRDHIFRQCEQSLGRLRCETLDLYQLHKPNPDFSIAETLEILEELRKAGKIRHVGLSNSAPWQLGAAAEATERLRLPPIACEQAPYNLLDRSIEEALIPQAKSHEIGVVVWSPLAEGLLSGKYRRGEQLPEDSRYAKFTRPEAYHSRLTPELFDRLEELERLAARAGSTLAEMSVSWCLAQEGVSSVLLGPSRRSQLEAGLKAMDQVIAPLLLEAVDQCSPRGNKLVSYYVPQSPRA